MKMKTKILFLPTARLTFDVVLAEQIFTQSKEMLLKLEDCDPIIPDGLLTDPGMLKEFIETKGLDSDLILFQDTTFSDGEFIKTAIDLVDLPVIVWGVREPSIGGRLRLNSLTGVMSTANFLHNNKKRYLYTMGNPTEDATITSIKKQITVLDTIKKLSHVTLGVVGEHPDGFFFSDTNPDALQNTFCVQLKHYDLQQWFDEAKDVSEVEYCLELEYAKQQIMNLKPEDETIKSFAQFVSVAKKYIVQDELSCIAMRCWPDFFVKLKVAPCGIFSQLTEQGFPTACEADIHGSISMYILQELTKGKAPYLGDVVNVHKDSNSIILWHCGFAPYSLSNAKKGAVAGVHPNRKMGLAMDFGIKPGEVTLFRVSYDANGYRFLITTGVSLDVPNSYHGTSAHVKLNQDAQEFVRFMVEEGYEPHVAMVHGDVSSELVAMGRILGIETILC